MGSTSRYHESLKNLRPTDVYQGRGQWILGQREIIKRKTLQMGLKQNPGYSQRLSLFLGQSPT